MKVNNIKACLAMTILGLFVLSSAAIAEVTWDQVKKKADGASSFEVTYRYDGPRGEFTFDHHFSKSKILTKIVDSDDKTRKGTILYWDKEFKNGDYVRAKTGGANVLRKTSHAEVEDTPFYQSIFTMIFKQLGDCGAPKASAEGDKTKFTFKCPGGDYEIWADSDANIVKTERIDKKNKGKNRKETREFSGHTWGGGAPSNPFGG